MPDKSNIAIICIFGMMMGFMISRVELSIAMFLFGINAIRDVSPRQWVRNKWWLLGVLWVAMYALTYFWSHNKAEWDIRWQTKFPFLLLPLAFQFMPRFTSRQLQVITILIALPLLGGVAYSLYYLVSNPSYYITQYRFSGILPTLPKYDHIRASLIVALFVVWGVYVWPFLGNARMKWFVAVCIAILVVYLHILAVKSGLVALYLFLIGWSLYMVFSKKMIIGLMIILALPVVFLLAKSYVPTFRERINYISYTIFMAKHGDQTGRFGDISRLYSYALAIDLIKQHPWQGVGTGDMQAEMDTSYARSYPEVPASARLLPHNQFLTVGLGCGIPTMLLFITWMFMPLGALKRNRASFFFFMVWLIVFAHMLIEPVFEVQLGVFVCLFFLLLQKHELQEV